MSPGLQNKIIYFCFDMNNIFSRRYTYYLLSFFSLSLCILCDDIPLRHICSHRLSGQPCLANSCNDGVLFFRHSSTPQSRINLWGHGNSCLIDIFSLVRAWHESNGAMDGMSTKLMRFLRNLLIRMHESPGRPLGNGVRLRYCLIRGCTSLRQQDIV